MRIGLIAVQSGPEAAGGPASGEAGQVAGLARALAARGHQVRIYTRRAGGPVRAGETLDGPVVIEQVPVGPPRRVPAGELLRHTGGFGRWLHRRWSEGWRPDVVHAYAWLSGLAAVTATRALAIPVVQTYHSLGMVSRRFLGPADASPDQRVGLERALGRVVDQVVAQSPAELAELARLGVARDAVTVIPTGVDTTVFAPRSPAGAQATAGTARGGAVGTRAAAGPSGDGLRILAVGGLDAARGYPDMLAALRLVPRAELVVAGGPEPTRLATDAAARRLRALADRLGVADRIRLLGAVPATAMPGWYRSADVLACTPQCPGSGLAAVEAMACGTPVVSYALGGLADTVVDRVTGRLVPPHDVVGFGAALRTLLASDVDRMAYAEAAVDRARACYAWDRVVGELERVYARVSGETRLSPALAG